MLKTVIKQLEYKNAKFDPSPSRIFSGTWVPGEQENFMVLNKM